MIRHNWTDTNIMMFPLVEHVLQVHYDHPYENMVPYTLAKNLQKKYNKRSQFDGLNAFASLHNANVLVDFYKMNTIIRQPTSL